MLFSHYWTIKSTLGVVLLHVEVQQYRTFSVTSGDYLTLDISLVCLDWFSFTIFYLWFCWIFQT